ERDVVDEQDDEAKDEAAERAVPAVRRSKRKAEHGKHQARHRNGELVLDGYPLAVRRDAVLLQFGDLFPEFGNRHLVGAERGGAQSREEFLWIERENDPFEAADLVLALGVGRMVDAVLHHDVDRLLLTVDEDVPVLRQVDGLWLTRTRVLHEHAIPPAAFGRYFPNVERDVRKRGERVRFDFAFGALRQDREAPLDKRTIA